MKQQERKVTVYTGGAFGVTKTEGKLVEYGRQDYAQYKSMPFVKFIPKGKRLVRGFQTTSHPYLVVVEGWNHVTPDDAFNKTEGGSISRYSCFDDRYKSDFDAVLTPYLASTVSAKVIIDIRYTAETDIMIENKYWILNVTDGVPASAPDAEMTEEEAKRFIAEFPNRYLAQGYYRNNRMEKMDPKDVVLKMVVVGEEVAV